MILYPLGLKTTAISMVTETHFLGKNTKCLKMNSLKRKGCACAYDVCVCVLLCALILSSVLFQTRITHCPYKAASSVMTGVVFTRLTSVPSEGVLPESGVLN